MEHPCIRGLSEWRPLARGGRAAVWQARQLSLGRLVAVKVYQSDLDEGGRRRFLREAAAVGMLSNHPGVVTLHDAGTLPDDRPYLIMELYPGGSLARWLKPANRPSEEGVRQVGVQIADALAAVHARDVLHRDVKPANILIDRFGNPALADFGLAVMASADAAVTDGLGMTPAYAPPEAFETLPATEAGDVFSLAATLYALIAGSPPRSVNCTGLEQMIEAANKPIRPNSLGQLVLDGRVDGRPEQRPCGSADRGRFPGPAGPCAGGPDIQRGLLSGLPTIRPSCCRVRRQLFPGIRQPRTAPMSLWQQEQQIRSQRRARW